MFGNHLVEIPKITRSVAEDVEKSVEVKSAHILLNS